jgi:hypothetical protein
MHTCKAYRRLEPVLTVLEAAASRRTTNWRHLRIADARLFSERPRMVSEVIAAIDIQDGPADECRIGGA